MYPTTIGTIEWASRSGRSRRRSPGRTAVAAAPAANSAVAPAQKPSSARLSSRPVGRPDSCVNVTQAEDALKESKPVLPKSTPTTATRPGTAGVELLPEQHAPEQHRRDEDGAPQPERAELGGVRVDQLQPDEGVDPECGRPAPEPRRVDQDAAGGVASGEPVATAARGELPVVLGRAAHMHLARHVGVDQHRHRLADGDRDARAAGLDLAVGDPYLDPGAASLSAEASDPPRPSSRAAATSAGRGGAAAVRYAGTRAILPGGTALPESHERQPPHPGPSARAARPRDEESDQMRAQGGADVRGEQR